jgi:hypothetical protein
MVGHSRSGPLQQYGPKEGSLPDLKVGRIQSLKGGQISELKKGAFDTRVPGRKRTFPKSLIYTRPELQNQQSQFPDGRLFETDRS